jgi:hypothetical protein
MLTLDLAVPAATAKRWVDSLFSIVPEHRPIVDKETSFCRFFSFLCQAKARAADAVSSHPEKYASVLPPEASKPDDPKEAASQNASD